ncbi:MAG: sigma-70 family RNA polymerase sigma factor [Verrucomicrobia bacterium]|nr:sigma-70 family RNA polymerase sigma factor [Verrucomicrobiota bacterium]
MTDSTHDTHPQGAGDERFGRTQWSKVLRAANPEAEGFASALQDLCQTYWYPLYAFVRRSGHSPQDAEDLTQAFFERLLDKNYLAAANREKGRFRTFLLVALKRFLANDWDRQHAQKRGGFASFVAIDQDHAETRYGGDLAHHEQPDVLLEKQWAMTLIAQVMGRLQAEYADSGRDELFGLLRASLTRDDSAMGYADIASRVGTSTAAVKMAAMRLRERYQALLREEIARTVASPDEIEDEIRYLFSVFSS